MEGRWYLLTQLQLDPEEQAAVQEELDAAYRSSKLESTERYYKVLLPYSLYQLFFADHDLRLDGQVFPTLLRSGGCT